MPALLTGTDVIALVAQVGTSLAGFAIGALTTAPPVYNPGGPVCLVDDFAVARSEEWRGGGDALLAALSR